MFTIGLEASRANKVKKTGTEWYAWHMLQQFKKIDPNNKFVVYYNDFLADDLQEVPANFLLKRLKWPFGKFWTHIRLGFELSKYPVDKFFASNAAPLFTSGEVTATIHDLGFLNNPELYHPIERVYQKVSHRLTIKKADKIIAPSEATKKDIIKFYPDAESKIKVIYHGWDKKDFKPVELSDQEKIRDHYNLPDKFILYIGRLEAKKNIVNLIRAYQKTDRSWPLVLAGRAGYFGYKQIEELAGTDDLKNDVIILGYISQQNYTKLLGAASLFAFPSKFEGFGIPVLEAMGVGIPVACSDLSVLREVAGDAAVYFNPDNVDDIKNKIEKIIKSSDLRKDLINKGHQQCQKFSWEKTARETLDFIIK